MYYKELYTTKPGGELPQLVVAENENLQSRFVVQKVLELREQGVPLQEMAILFRSSFLSFDLEIELSKANIPFVKFGGFKFVETAHVKDMIAYLRVLENPRDVVAWNRILLLVDGVGPRTAEKVIDDILKRRVPANPDSDASMVTEKFWSEYNAYPDNVQKLFTKLKEVAPAKIPPGEKSYHMLKYYEPILRVRYDDHQKRKKDLEMFQNITERYRNIDELLTDLALEPPNESVVDIESPGPEDEYLTLSTIHSAKGLEWNSVFVIYALEGRFPTMRSAASDEEMEEERRLMYVACTRAKQNLFISYPINIYDRESGMILTKPSRFIQGIGENLLEPWVIE
ncbi:MAG: ATP-dependent helicase [Ignavibacteriae bacterium]|nr:ATP-dependent helicase [Ignavibacteriota bacterium]MCI0707921.1 ATP-dependent helicase [Ignavibacteriota bacterium]